MSCVKKWGLKDTAFFKKVKKFYSKSSLPKEFEIYDYPYFIYLKYLGENKEEKEMFTLTSSAFENGGIIPDKNVEDSLVSPPLKWENAPEGTECFFLVMTDQDIPGQYRENLGKGFVQLQRHFFFRRKSRLSRLFFDFLVLVILVF